MKEEYLYSNTWTKEILNLSTNYTDETVEIRRRGTFTEKPKAPGAYNTGKSFKTVTAKLCKRKLP